MFVDDVGKGEMGIYGFAATCVDYESVHILGASN